MTALRASHPLRGPVGQIVPTALPMTTDELHALPDDRWTYELVSGVLVACP